MNKSLKQITYIGAYGIVTQNAHIVLTTKIEEGPYRGLLDLPGGGIEFGESVGETLKREFREEIAMNPEDFYLFDNLSYHGAHEKYIFHHIGLIYVVKAFSPLLNVQPQDIFNWYPIEPRLAPQLTPFAKEVLERLLSGEIANCARNENIQGGNGNNMH